MRRQSVLIFATAAATLLLASVAVLAATTVLKGGAINQVRVVRGEDASAFNNSTTFADIPGATTTVPRGEKGLILVRYSDGTICYIVEGTTNTGDNKCSVRIMAVNNATGQQIEACPCNQGTNFAFDSMSAGTENVFAQESHSMDRPVIVPRGRYTVQAQWAVTHADVRFRWTTGASRSRKRGSPKALENFVRRAFLRSTISRSGVVSAWSHRVASGGTHPPFFLGFVGGLLPSMESAIHRHHPAYSLS